MPDYRLPASKRQDQRRILTALLHARPGVSQRVLARRLQTEEAKVSRWMAGWTIIDAYWIVRLGEVLALSDAEVRTLATAAANLTYEWDQVDRPSLRAPPLQASREPHERGVDAPRL